ncbi:MAG TPA: cytochrome P450 [Actinomycetota bacterium]|nr:cytochrome P450 [Actinomycetota bacterium]
MAVESQDRVIQKANAAAAPMAPGPKGLPLLGPAIQMRRDLVGFMHSGMLEYGDVVRVAAGFGKYAFEAFGIFHPEGAQRVLAGNADNYDKSDQAYEEVRNLLGNGLLTSEGDVWKRQKRMVQPLFTHKRVAAYVPLIADEAQTVVDRWRPAQVAGTPVDLHEEMTRVTLRVVGRAVFGTDVDHMIPVFKDSVPYLSRRAFERGVMPVRVPEDWPLPSNRKAAAYKADIYAVVDELIASRRAHPTGGDDLVNMLLRAQDPEGGEGLSDEEVRDQALIFLMAGHETTATALTFTLHLLGLHPEVQARVHEEVDQVLGDGEPTMEQALALQYTTQTIKEAMRLYPSAHSTPRTAVTDDVISGYRIPAGAVVVPSPWVTHRHPAFWDEPGRYDPDRFTPEREKARHRYAYFPFGGGPRACIGQYFSMLESVFVTALLMRNYDVKTVDGKVKLFQGITLRPNQPMPAHLTPR